MLDTLRLPPGFPQQLASIDRFWYDYRHGDAEVAEVVVSRDESLLGELDCDVIIGGGTLGILIGTALQQKGWRVVIIERGKLQGRTQEWNISRRELKVLLALDLLNEAELDRAIVSEYNPARVGFHEGIELWVKDILNIGIDPVFLLATLKTKFLAAGGKILEDTRFDRAEIYRDGVAVVGTTIIGDSSNNICVKGRLLLDVMGHFSAIAKQARWLTLGNIVPEGVCMVVGSCAKGLPEVPHGDLIYTFTPIERQCQYFWEAFPARDGRTTYMFTYADADPKRPSFSELFTDYISLLPQYQNIENITTIDFQRILMGFFPAYRQSPLQTPWMRVLQIGDSSGLQSPLSFGGFGAMLRHLERLTAGINSALTEDFLARDDLRALQPYQPNLSVTWLFQKSMSVRVDRTIEGDRINRLLSTTFTAMEKLGDDVLLPFLQDIIQLPALSQTMLAMAVADPILIAGVVKQVGLANLADWMVHYLNLGSYSILNQLDPLWQTIGDRRYHWQCRRNAWLYGSGGDYPSV
jgi:lycopene cyclase CruP